MIHLGTAGYHYDDWVGPVYPADLPRSQWLSHYAQRFGLVEINSSFYHPPSAAMVAGWSRRVPSDFRFVLKAWRGLTHGEPPPNEPFAAFATALEPLREREQLLGVLVQYPTAIKLEKANVRRLRQLREQWPDLPLIVEFRHVSWADPRTYDFLREQRLSWCCVDEPQLRGLMPPVCVATASPAYVRFHGRNARQWYDHEFAWQRYDYLYSEEELRPWIARIRELATEAEEVCVVFNNHYDGQAPTNAAQLRLMLEA